MTGVQTCALPICSARVQGTQIPGNGPVLTLRRIVALIGVDGVRTAANSLRAWPGALDDVRAGALRATIDKVRLAGQDVELTGIEFDILLALARRAGRVVGRDALLDEAGRGDVNVGDRTVDVHISHLRQKLGDDPRSPKKIKTIRGVGYVLVKDGA